jgi:hypothetical protein
VTVPPPCPVLTHNQPICHPSLITPCPTSHEILCVPSVAHPCQTLLLGGVCGQSVLTPCLPHTFPPQCPIASGAACPPQSLGCPIGGGGVGPGPVAQAAIHISAANVCGPVHASLFIQQGCGHTANIVACSVVCPTSPIRCFIPTHQGCPFPTQFCPSAFCPSAACGFGGIGGLGQ